MNSRHTWILLLVAVGLAGYLRFVEHRDAIWIRTANGGHTAFRPLDLASMHSLELQRSNQVMKVERDGTGWWLKYPVSQPAQSAGIDRLVDILKKLEPTAFVTPAEFAAQPGGLAAFGLQPPQALLTIESATDRTLLNIGARSPVGNRFYFQRVGSDGVFVADVALLEALPASANDWRDRSLLGLRDAHVDRIEIRGQTDLKAERDPPTGVWRLTRPLAARADGARLERLLNELQNARIAEFVTDAPAIDATAFGLQPPAIEFVAGHGSNDLVRLQIGRSPTNQPSWRYVRNLIRTNVSLVPSNALTPLEAPLSAFRDRQLTPPLDAASYIRFRFGTNETALEREGTNWWIQIPRRFPADPAGIAHLIAELASIEIIEFPADVVTDFTIFGLAEPQREFTLGVRATNGVATITNQSIVQIQFGRPLTNNPALVYVRRADEPGVYAVPKIDFRLPETPNQLRDWHFASTNVLEIRVQRGGRTRLFQRSRGGSWNTGEPSLPSESFDELLHRLSDWNSVRFAIRDEAAFLKGYKFADRSHEISLVFRERSGPFQRWRLRFGADLGTEVVVLANFDDDPTAIHLKLPRNLYEDLYHLLPVR
ncbi:MAG: DUF4340 domain-containing protein [Pedosphaera sp.]|nr:DUF4340 domain-containing protein [Pedosphaera sp.]